MLVYVRVHRFAISAEFFTLMHLTPSPFGHESHCPGEVHQGQSDRKVPQLTAGTGAEDRLRFAIPAEAIHAFSSEEA